MASNTENRYASIYINGNAADDTLKTLRDSSRKLKNELDKLPRSSVEFAEKAKTLKEVEERLSSLRKEATGVGSAFDNMGGELKSALGGSVKSMLGWGAIGVTLVESGRKIITQNAKLSDSFAGVMKTTGLSLVEVESLDRALSKFNTRTAKDELLGLAQVAGKLGISELKQVEGFVRAADMIGVALGEDLGGTEEAVNSLGKLADIFKLTEEFGIEQALLKIGSAINSLGAAGTANEAYMIDFTNRLAGIAPAANISMGDVLGLAATLDSLGQSGEKSSTAIGKFFVEMGADSKKFAKIAKMDVAEFNELLREDANEAFLRVLESSNAASGGIESLAKSMNALEVKDSGGVAALGALANNIDKVRESQLLGNEELEKGTSIINEFNTVNNNLQGNLEKIWNKIGQLWENGAARNGLTKLTASVVDWMDKLSGADHAVQRSVETFNQQKATIEASEGKLQSLTGEYDKLKSKSILTKDEQVKLNDTVNAIASIVPEAISQWDQYGRAMDINRGKVEGFTKAQRELLAIQNKDTIQDLEKEFDKYVMRAGGWQNNASRTSKVLSSGKSVQGDVLTASQKGLLTKDYNYYNDSKTLDMGKAYEAAKAIREVGGKLKPAMERVINYFEGPSKSNSKDTSKGTVNTTVGDTSGKNSKKTEAEREAEKAKETYDKLLKEDDSFKLAMSIADKSWFDQQLAKEAEQYDKQITSWKEFLDQKGLTKDQKNEANSKIDQLTIDKENAVSKKTVALEEELSKKIGEIRGKLTNKLLNEHQREENSINEHYDALVEKYKGNAEMQVLIEKNRSIDLSDAKIREEERFHKEAELLQNEAELSKLTDSQREELAFTQKMNTELQALRDKYSASLQETEMFKQAEDAILERYANAKAQREEELEKKKQTDIRNAVIDSAQSIADAVFTIGANNRDRELQTRLTKLDTERERELSAKNLTEAQKKRINEKYDALERKEKEKAWKAQQKADSIQAGINTALAVTRALPNWINAAAVAVAGAAQIAVIASQKTPQFYHGGYTGEEPQGWVRKPTVFTNTASGKPFSAGENYKGEYVISSSQLNDPLVADFVSMMESGRKNDVSRLTAQPQIIQAPIDLSGLEKRMDGLAAAYNSAQEKRVVLVYQDLEDAHDKKMKIQYSANS